LRTFPFFGAGLIPDPFLPAKHYKCAFTAHIAYSACSRMLQVRICCNTAYCNLAFTAYIAYSACSHMLQVRICCNTAYCKYALTAYIVYSACSHMLQVRICCNTAYCKCALTAYHIFCTFAYAANAHFLQNSTMQCIWQVRMHCRTSIQQTTWNAAGSGRCDL